MTRVRRYGQDQLVSSNLEITPIYMAAQKYRSDTSYGQDVQPVRRFGYQALFTPNTDIIETDSIIYEGREVAIQSYHKVQYRNKSYVIKVEFS